MVSQQAAASSKDIKHPHTQQDLQVDAPPSEQSKEKPCSKGKISTEGFTSVPLASTCNSYITFRFRHFFSSSSDSLLVLPHFLPL